MGALEEPDPGSYGATTPNLLLVSLYPSGGRCAGCAPGYYGHPSQPSGRCQPCQCNNNIDMSDAAACDRRTGECKRCLYNTEGPACGICRSGYFGDASRRNCRSEARPPPRHLPLRPRGVVTRVSSPAECTCNFLGTERGQCVERDECVCQRASGQCQCLRNVIGLACDHCAPNHWNLASGRGCEPCGCDPNNSVSSSCNEAGTAGREAPWRALIGPHVRLLLPCSSPASVSAAAASEGRPAPTARRTTGETPGPSVEVRAAPVVTWSPWHHQEKGSGSPPLPPACDCDRRGIKTSQCNRATGHCVCLQGVSGVRCDQCARGFSGQFPNCQPCHQCFGDWDRIVQVRLRLDSLVFDQSLNRC